MSSRSPAAAVDLAIAEAMLERRRRASGRTFSSVNFALEWFWRMREAMQSPQGLHPRGEPVAGTNQVVWVNVDGGKGGDLDEVLVTLSTIGAALEELRHHNPVGHGILLLSELEGKTLRAIAEKTGLSVGKCSYELGKAIDYLAAWLRCEGILR